MSSTEPAATGGSFGSGGASSSATVTCTLGMAKVAG